MITSMNTMSTQTRKYELKARAEGQRETRERIAKAAAGLHEEQGVARTTVAEIARRAGVTRLTVYNHFADLDELIPACAAHYESLHPAPDLSGALAEADAFTRARDVLGGLYGFFRETEPMYGKLFRDRLAVPELDRFLEQNFDRMQAELAGAMLEPFRLRGKRAQSASALIYLALDFWTWSRLNEQGLDDAGAAELMAGVIADAARA
jgi:AcrR family transcriptional regulator